MGSCPLEVDDKRVKHRKMLIEPLSFVLDVPPQGPGARRYMNNYINIAETYGGVEKVKLGKESTTTGEKLKMVASIASIGINVASVMFGDFSSAISVATGVNGLAHTIGLSQRQVKRLDVRPFVSRWSVASAAGGGEEAESTACGRLRLGAPLRYNCLRRVSS